MASCATTQNPVKNGFITQLTALANVLRNISREVKLPFVTRDNSQRANWANTAIASPEQQMTCSGLWGLLTGQSGSNSPKGTSSLRQSPEDSLILLPA